MECCVRISICSIYLGPLINGSRGFNELMDGQISSVYSFLFLSKLTSVISSVVTYFGTDLFHVQSKPLNASVSLIIMTPEGEASFRTHMNISKQMCSYSNYTQFRDRSFSFLNDFSRKNGMISVCSAHDQFAAQKAERR